MKIIATIVLAAALAWIPMGAHARSTFTPAPLGYSCEQVRWAYAHFTAEHLREMGEKLGIHLTGAQRREAQNCLKK